MLQTPIEGRTRVTLRTRRDDLLRFTSEAEDEVVALRAGDVHDCLKRSAADRRRWLDDRQVPTFARYPLGCLLVLADERGVWPGAGLDFEITSTVPRSMGVSSSAALEVATLRALEQHFAVPLAGTELARLGQRAENEVVGAPCGLMDQLASAHGEPGALLPIVCRPDLLEPPVRLPDGIAIVGWPSGVRHDVGATPYATARAATFMGFEIFRRALRGDWKYPAEITPELFDQHRDVVPESMSGKEYLARFGEIQDDLSVLDLSREYRTRASLEFPVRENARARVAVSMLRAGVEDVLGLTQLGAVMFQSHAGYTSIGLGSDETDKMVALVASLVAEPRVGAGFYGARVSGGGSGGTVVVLMRSSAIEVLDQARRTIDVQSAAHTPFVFSARSAGAVRPGPT